MTITIPKPMIIIELNKDSHIGLHILKRRLELSMNQKNVATLLGIKPASITHWETGKVIPRDIYSAKIIQFLGYNPYSFKTGFLGQRIRAYRLLHGYTLKEFAKLLSVTECTVVSWQADYKPNAGNLEKLNRIGCILKQLENL
jgi:transcriptional regulator with XRE-family HTH domain